jgi:hypothetical protein
MRNETHLLAPTIHADPAAFIGAAGVDFRCRRFGGAARAPMRRLLLGFRKSVSGAGTEGAAAPGDGVRVSKVLL